ncbi:MAG: hypothetical protein Q8M94_22850, partial [Ignavibacteria bacterium]|nr:hypothetical protein [Ignavibacteria bacterium]
MKKLVVICLVLSSFAILFPQHLPLQIGNQWHYEMISPGMNYAGIVVDEVTINGKIYFEIERRHYNTGELLETTYDRLDGDSAYYRIRNGPESLIINFNWPDGYTQVTQIDSNCISIRVLQIGSRNVWGFNTVSFNFWSGFWCIGMEDTLWALTPYSITRLFGSYWSGDGWLRGAIIEGITYGTLHPLPVELLSFTSSVVDNNVTLNWTTATETNNSGFSIERKKVFSPPSAVGNTEWESISFINGNGTTTETKSYSYKDENLYAGKYQYRLKQIDFDGTFEYSNTIEAEINP